MNLCAHGPHRYRTQLLFCYPARTAPGFVNRFFYSFAVQSYKKAAGRKIRPAVLAQREGFEPSCDCSQTDFESLEAGVFWSILSASLRLSERRKPLILLGFPAFLLSAQDFGNFPVKADFPEKCEHSVSVL